MKLSSLFCFRPLIEPAHAQAPSRNPAARAQPRGSVRQNSAAEREASAISARLGRSRALSRIVAEAPAKEGPRYTGRLRKGINPESFKRQMHDCAVQFLITPSWKKRAAIVDDMVQHLHDAQSRLRELGLNDRLALFDALSPLNDAVDTVDAMVKAQGTGAFLKAVRKGARTNSLKTQVLARMSSELHAFTQRLKKEPSPLQCAMADLFPDLGNDRHNSPPARSNAEFDGHLRNFKNAALKHIVPIPEREADVQVRISALNHLEILLAKIDDKRLATLPGNEKAAFSDALKILSDGVEKEEKIILDKLSKDEDVVLIEHPESRAAQFKLKALGAVSQELDRLSGLCSNDTTRPDDRDRDADSPLRDVNLELFKERMHGCSARLREANSWEERGSAADHILDAIDGVEGMLHVLEPRDKYELLAVLSILQREVHQKAGEARGKLPFLKQAGRLTDPDLWKAKRSLTQASNKLRRLVQQMESEPGSLSHAIAGLSQDLRTHEFNNPPASGDADTVHYIETFGRAALRHLAVTEGGAQGVQARLALWGYLRSQLARIDQRCLSTLQENEKEYFSMVIDSLWEVASVVAEENRTVAEGGGKVPIEHDEAARPQMKALDPVCQELNRLTLLCKVSPIDKSLPKERIQPDEDMPSIPEHDELHSGPAEEEMPEILRKRAEMMEKQVIKRRERKPS